MTTNKPETVAWRWCQPIVNDHGETVGGVWKLGASPNFLPWWTNDPLVRLGDFEAMKAAYEEELFCVRQTRDSHFGELMRALEQVDALQVECEKLRAALSESQANDRQAMYYLNQVRKIVGGYDFPDMVERCRELVIRLGSRGRVGAPYVRPGDGDVARRPARPAESPRPDL